MIRNYIIETTGRVFFNVEGTSKKDILTMLKMNGFDILDIKSVRLSKKAQR